MSNLIQLNQVYEKKLRSHRNEKERVSLLCEYATEIKQFDLKRSIELAEEAFQLAVPLFDKKGMAESLKIMGEIHYKTGNYSAAVLKLTEAIGIYTDLCAYEDLVLCNRFIGASYAKIGSYTKAIEHHNGSYAFSKKINSSKYKANTLNDLGLVYVRIKEYEKALSCFFECEKLYLEINDLLCLGQTYNNLGFTYHYQENYQEALTCYIKALHFFKAVNCTRTIGIGLNNIGSALVSLKNNEEALPYLNECLQLKESMKDSSGIAVACINLAEAYFYLKKLDSGLECLKRAMMIGEALKSKDILISGHVLFISYYEVTRNNEKMFYHRQVKEQLQKECEAEKELDKIKNIAMAETLEKTLKLRKE